MEHLFFLFTSKRHYASYVLGGKYDNNDVKLLKIYNDEKITAFLNS